MMDEIELMKKVFEQIRDQKFTDTKLYSTKQVGDIISIVAIMVADPEPAKSEKLYRKLIAYLNLPKEIESHLFGQILAARHALKTAMALAAGKIDPLSMIQDLLSEFSIEEDDE